MKDLTIKQFIDATSSSTPTPGGGSVAALIGACASALTAMVANLTINKKGYEQYNGEMQEILSRICGKNDLFLASINEDVDAYNQVMHAYRLPKSNEEEISIRKNKIQEALKIAMQAPLNLARLTLTLFEDIRFCAINGNVNAISDAAVAAILARSTILACICNVKINLSMINDTTLADAVNAEIVKIQEEAILQEKEILKLTNNIQL